MQLAIGTAIGIAFCLIVLGVLGIFERPSEIIQQRNELVRLSKSVVKAYRFKGYAQVAGYEIGALGRYLEGMK